MLRIKETECRQKMGEKSPETKAVTGNNRNMYIITESTASSQPEGQNY